MIVSLNFFESLCICAFKSFPIYSAQRFVQVKKTTLFRIIFFPVIFSIILWFFFARVYHPPIQERTQLLMDTYWTIKIPGGKNRLPVINNVFKRLKEIDTKFNISDEKGQLSQFNQHNIPITDPEIIAVIKRARDVNAMTEGAFDITVGPILEAFGFFSRNYRVPPQTEIDELLKHVGMKYLNIQDNRVTKIDPKVGIDLGGVAKSYAIAEAVKVIKNSCIKNALVDGGGDIYAMGFYAGKPWLIGVRHPRNDELLGEISVTDMGVFSSGDYERYFIEKGVRYHHILNPKTGYPAHGLIGTTVIYGNVDKIGGLSSSVFIMGPVKGIHFIDQIKGAAAVMVDDNQKVLFSKELNRNRLNILK